MPDDTLVSSTPIRPLRERLQARGAKAHSRMSDLARYMLAHHDELEALITIDGYAWADIAALLAEEEGLTDQTGKPVSAGIAKLTWSRLRRRDAKPGARQRVEPPPDLTHPPNQDHVPASDAAPRLPFASPADPPPRIQPARPRGMLSPAVPVAPQPLSQPAPAAFDRQALQQRLDDLARQQAVGKIPPPDPL